MNGRAVAVFLSGMLFACAPTPPPSGPPPVASAQPATPASASQPSESQRLVIRRVSCARLLNAAVDDRAAGSMFYLGYEAARLGISTIDVNEIEGLETAALSYCAGYPDRPAADAFAHAFRELGR
jgi:hypothetical protein